MLALVYQAFLVYFTLSFETVVPSGADEHRYLVTAGATLFAMAAASVPQDRWKPEPRTYEPPEGYMPCYSGTECDAAG